MEKRNGILAGTAALGLAVALVFWGLRDPRAAEAIAPNPSAIGPAEPSAEPSIGRTPPVAEPDVAAHRSLPSTPPVADVAALEGRVVYDESDRPVYGIGVSLLRGEELVEQVSTDSKGTFRIEPGSGGPHALVLEAPEYLQAVEPRFEVDPAAPPGDLVFRVLRIGGAPLAGRLVDAATGEPVPFCAIAISRFENDPEELETDAEGRFESRRSYRRRSLGLTVRDLSDRRFGRFGDEYRVDHDPDGPELEVEVQVGPTYSLELALPEGLELEHLIARLASASSEGDPSHGLTGPLRAGPLPWARFTHRRMSQGLRPPWVLSVGAAAGGWSGSAPVTSVTGIYPEPVRIELSPVGGLTGRLLDGEKKADWAFLTISREGAPPIVEGPLNADSYRVDYLEPGVYEVSAYSRRHERVGLRVEVLAGDATQHDVVLLPRDVGGPISGYVTSTGGARHANLPIVLRSSEYEGLVWIQRARWEANEDRGTFEFSDVPAGEYELLVSTSGLEALVEPARLSVSPPFEGVHFVVREGEGEDDLETYRLCAVDATSDECIDGPLLQARPRPDGPRLTMSTTACWLELGGGRMSSRFEWALRCPGYASGFGDETSFSERDDEGAFVLRVPLRRGWSGRVRVRDSEGGALTGIEVLFDGESAGHTDEAGRVDHFSPERPARLELVYADWRVTGGDVDAGGSFRDSGFDIEVRMGPPGEGEGG